MQLLIWIGSILALIGVALILWCILLVYRAKKAALPEEEFKARLQKYVILNMAALGISGLGFVVVVMGILLR